MPPARSLRITDLTRTIFAPLVGGNFVLRPQRRPSVAVVLSQATGLPAPRGVTGEAFSLLFTGAPSAFLAPGIHALEHPALGSIQMFVTPVGRGQVAHDFEVIVNRNLR